LAISVIISSVIPSAKYFLIGRQRGFPAAARPATEFAIVRLCQKSIADFAQVECKRTATSKSIPIASTAIGVARHAVRWLDRWAAIEPRLPSQPEL